MANYTREEAMKLAVFYLDEARASHEQTADRSDRSRHSAMRAANAIELSKTFMMLHDRLPQPELRQPVVHLD